MPWNFACEVSVCFCAANTRGQPYADQREQLQALKAAEQSVEKKSLVQELFGDEPLCLSLALCNILPEISISPTEMNLLEYPLLPSFV